MSSLQLPTEFKYEMSFSIKAPCSTYITSSSWSLHVFPLSLSLSIKLVDLDLVCVVKLPWAEAIVGCDGKLNVVHYKVCNEVDGKEKTISI